MSKSLNLIDINNYAVQKMKSESEGEKKALQRPTFMFFEASETDASNIDLYFYSKFNNRTTNDGDLLVITGTRASFSITRSGQKIYEDSVFGGGGDNSIEQKTSVFKQPYKQINANDGTQVKLSSSGSSRKFLFGLYYPSLTEIEKIETIIKRGPEDIDETSYIINDLKYGDILICSTITAGGGDVFSLNKKNFLTNPLNTKSRVVCMEVLEDAETAVLTRNSNGIGVLVTLIRFKSYED